MRISLESHHSFIYLLKRCCLWVLIPLLGILGCSNNSNKRVKLFEFVQQNDVKAARKLLDKNPDLVKATDRWGAIALNRAVEDVQPEMVKLLVEYGSDVHHEDSRTGLPLCEAAYHGDFESVQYLLDGGADVEYHTKRPSSQGPPLYNACSGGSAKTVKILLEHGAKVNAQWDNVTPIHGVVRGVPYRPDRLECVRLLVEAGADVNFKDANGMTSLAWAENVIARTKDSNNEVNQKRHPQFIEIRKYLITVGAEAE